MATTPRKFKKGAPVYLFNSWNDAGVFSVSTMKIEAAGAKIIRATYEQDGQFIGNEIQTRNADACLMLVSECPDPIAEGTRRAAQWIKDRIAYGHSRLEWNKTKGEQIYHEESIRAEIARLEAATPTARHRPELVAAVSAKYQTAN